MYLKILLHTTLFYSFAMQSFSQEVPGMNKESDAMSGTHRITLGGGHTHLSKGKNAEGKTGWLAVPSWSLSYDFWVTNKWAIGLQTDIVMENSIVKEEGGSELERKKPFAVVPVAIFKPSRHFSLIGGTGIELEKEDNLALTRLGIEYGWELPNAWETGITVMWDNKWGHYNSWALEFSFSKLFFHRKRQ